MVMFSKSRCQLRAKTRGNPELTALRSGERERCREGGENKAHGETCLNSIDGGRFDAQKMDVEVGGIDWKGESSRKMRVFRPSNKRWGNLPF